MFRDEYCQVGCFWASPLRHFSYSVKTHTRNKLIRYILFAWLAVVAIIGSFRRIVQVQTYVAP